MRLHSFLSNKCQVKKSRVAGMGVFAKKKFKKNEIVAIWGGVVYTAKEVDRLSKKFPHFSTHTVSVYDGFYLGPITTEGDFDNAEIFNHSCNPNIGIRGQILVVARKKINIGEELYFDYDTTETSSEGWFICNCKSKFCRKKIDGSAWKNKKFVEKNWKYLSLYIQEKCKKHWEI